MRGKNKKVCGEISLANTGLNKIVEVPLLSDFNELIGSEWTQGVHRMQYLPVEPSVHRALLGEREKEAGERVCVYVSLSRVWLACHSMDCSRPGSSGHGISQARVLEWVATSFSRGSCPPGDGTQVSCIAGRFFTLWATREAQREVQILLPVRRDS